MARLFFCGSLDLGSGDFEKYEGVGLSAVGRTAFVLVAGGLGERLGYSGIKLSLPAETLSATAGVSTSTGMCYLELYIRQNVSIRTCLHISQRLPSPSLSIHRISPDPFPPDSFPHNSFPLDYFPPDSSRPFLPAPFFPPDPSRPIRPHVHLAQPGTFSHWDGWRRIRRWGVSPPRGVSQLRGVSRW